MSGEDSDATESGGLLQLFKDLDTVLALIESAAMFVLVASIAGKATNSANLAKTGLRGLLEVLEKNWHGALILLIPFAFRPIRLFMSEATEFAGMKRRRSAAGTPATARNDER